MLSFEALSPFDLMGKCSESFDGCRVNGNNESRIMEMRLDVRKLSAGISHISRHLSAISGDSGEQMKKLCTHPYL